MEREDHELYIGHTTKWFLEGFVSTLNIRILYCRAE